MEFKYLEGFRVAESDNPQAVWIHLQVEGKEEPESFVNHTMDVPHMAAALLHHAQNNSERVFAGMPENCWADSSRNNFSNMQRIPIKAYDMKVSPDGAFQLDLGFCTLFFQAAGPLAERLAGPQKLNTR